MDSRKMFQDIYQDFFGIESISQKEEETVDKSDNQEIMADLFTRIDKLSLEDESKNLLKQIIEYMRKVDEKIESNYIPFSIVVDNYDRTDIKEIIDILTSSIKQYSYLENNSIKEISFFHLEKEFNIKNIYNEYGVVIFNDFKGFDILSESEKKIITTDLYNGIKDSKCLTLLIGNSMEMNDFYLTNKDLKDYLTFKLIYKKPDIQDVYQDLLSKVELNDEEQISLLDYITNTINEVKDFETYKEYLLRELSFHKRVPVVEKPKTLEEIFSELNELVGLDKVKKVLNELVDVMDLKKKTDDLKISSLNLHMVFLGNPGTGKTTVARILANILYNLKYIRTNNLIEVSAKDLVAEYVGQTAPKTNAVIEKALGGVLFVDEAYSLAVKNDNSFNAEAIATLIQAMENYRSELVVIFAGYTKEMQDFLNSNSGITSRIGYTLEFEDYTEEELIQIFIGMVKKNGFEVTDEALAYLREIINENKDADNFGNARFIRNVYEKTIVRHASNTKNKKQKKVLRTITKEDINTEHLI